MTQDVDGRWVGFKYNHRSAYLYFTDGHKCMINICEDCLAAPNLSDLLTAICAPGSTAGSDEVLRRLQEKGVPVSIEEVRRGR